MTVRRVIKLGELPRARKTASFDAWRREQERLRKEYEDWLEEIGVNPGLESERLRLLKIKAGV